jgi:hypothetical protein
VSDIFELEHHEDRILSLLSASSLDTGRPGIYDILDPIVHKRDQGIVTEPNEKSHTAVPGQSRDRQQDLVRLQQYAQRLTDVNVNLTIPPDETDVEKASDEERLSADDSITRHIRSSKPAHFDIHKHGEPVAEIDLARSAYRVGEPITGVVKVNEDAWRLQVLKVSLGWPKLEWRYVLKWPVST